MTISENGYTINVSSTSAATLAPSYQFAATSGFSGAFTAFNAPVASIRIAGVIQCYGMQITDGQLALVSLGGAGVGGYDAQCSPASYAGPNMCVSSALAVAQETIPLTPPSDPSLPAPSFTKPNCASQPGSKAPYVSSILFSSTSHTSSSDAQSSALASLVGALVLGAAAIALKA